jgi:hypothetical protein
MSMSTSCNQQHDTLARVSKICVTLIFEAFEYVALNSPLFHNVFLEIILFNLFIPGGGDKVP